MLTYDRMAYAVALKALYRAAEPAGSRQQAASSRQQAAEQPQGARDLLSVF
jgi:hypothetical protein